MPLIETLQDDVKKIFRETWNQTKGFVVPESEDLGPGNDAVRLNGVVLCADIFGSTKLVDEYESHLSSEIYKSFLSCAAKLIKEEGGSIAGYHGDSIMGVFIGGDSNTCAVRCALKINYAVNHVINPAIRVQYPDNDHKLHHCVGIDSGPLWVTRAGVRETNDLVWVGRAANSASKLAKLPHEHPTWIAKSVFTEMSQALRYTNGKPMWEQRVWAAMGDAEIYRSNWKWRID